MIELYVLLLVIALVPIVFAGTSRARIELDFFFMLFLLSGVVYIAVAPSLVALGEDAIGEKTTANYPAIQAYIVTLFLLPMAATYRLLSGSLGSRMFGGLEFGISEPRIIGFCLFFLCFEVAFIALAINSDMYVRRISSEKIAEVVSGLNIYQLVVLRTHDLATLPAISLLAILMPAIKRTTRCWVYRLALITLVTIVLSYSIYAVLNSRTLLIFLVIALWYGNLRAQKAKIKLSAAGFVLVLVTIIYGFIVIANIRNHGTDAGLSEIMNPATIVTEADSQAFNKWEWTQRLDCANLISQMDDSLQKKGYEWGQAWERPLVAMYGPLIGLERAAEYKAEATTTAKTYLMEVHTDIELKDYFSCMVTDLWGNFWVYGLPVAAMLVATVFVLLRYGLTISQSPSIFVTTLIVAFYFVSFEREFVEWLFGWIKLLPAIALLVALNPINKISVQNRAGISS